MHGAVGARAEAELGRKAVTLAAGLTHFPWRRFAVFDAVAAVIWASYAALLGYYGGRAFEEQPWKGLLLAVGIAFAVTLGSELVRSLLRRHHTQAVDAVFRM